MGISAVKIEPGTVIELEKTNQAIYCKSEKNIKEKLIQKTKLTQNKNVGKINDLIKNFITTLPKWTNNIYKQNIHELIREKDLYENFVIKSSFYGKVF